MKWIYGNNNDITNISCINPYKHIYHVVFTPTTNLNKQESLVDIPEDEEDNINIRYIIKKFNSEPILEEIKKHLLYLQSEYDTSIEVNSFYLNGQRVWLDKATRVGLVNSLTLEKSTGKIDTVLWLDDISIEINIDKALTLLTSVEIYAKECYNNTHKHLSDIDKLETIDECLAFDITANYPNKLYIEIE